MPLTATASDRGFNDAEFSAGTAKAQVAMAASGLAGMLLMSEQDVRYFTGFHTLFWGTVRQNELETGRVVS